MKAEDFAGQLGGFLQEAVDEDENRLLKAFKEERNKRDRERRREELRNPERRRQHNKRQRELYNELMQDPERRERYNRKHRERARARYNNDPDYRDRLLKYRRDRNHGRLRGLRKLIRGLIFSQGWLCGICKQPLPDDLGQVEIDHVVPSSRGGTDDYDNLQATCMSCNRSKGNKMMDELDKR